MLSVKMSTIHLALTRLCPDPVYVGIVAFCNWQPQPGGMRGTVSEHWVCPARRCWTKGRLLVPSAHQAKSPLEYWIPSMQQIIIRELGRVEKGEAFKWVPEELAKGLMLWKKARKSKLRVSNYHGARCIRWDPIPPTEAENFTFQKSVSILINNKKNLFSIFRWLAIIRSWEKYKARCLPGEAGLSWREKGIKNARWPLLSAK